MYEITTFYGYAKLKKGFIIKTQKGNVYKTQKQSKESDTVVLFKQGNTYLISSHYGGSIAMNNNMSKKPKRGLSKYPLQKNKGVCYERDSQH